ncbi:MAG: hypothetical protein KDA96_29160, partial [Planctomycetaceae bacterium]|nr:hypothetical protein [Planctomycetaceae bacterium]
KLMPPSAHNHNQDQQSTIRDLLGYLNFSDGTPNGRFRECMNQVFLQPDAPASPVALLDLLTTSCTKLEQSQESAFADLSRAVRVSRYAFEQILPAYRQHHQHLLAHLKNDELFTPFFLTRVLEAALATGVPDKESEAGNRIGAALRHLNDFLGYRPVAILENGRRMQPYDHERFCAVPLYYAEG